MDPEVHRELHGGEFEAGVVQHGNMDVLDAVETQGDGNHAGVGRGFAVVAAGDVPRRGAGACWVRK